MAEQRRVPHGYLDLNVNKRGYIIQITAIFSASSSINIGKRKIMFSLQHSVEVRVEGNLTYFFSSENDEIVAEKNRNLLDDRLQKLNYRSQCKVFKTYGVNDLSNK